MYIKRSLEERGCQEGTEHPVDTFYYNIRALERPTLYDN